MRDLTTEGGLASPKGTWESRWLTLCASIGIAIGVFLVSPGGTLDAQEPGSDYQLRLAPVLTRSVGDSPPRYDFGFGLDWRLGDFLSIWGAGFTEEMSRACLDSNNDCSPGDFVGSIGINLHYSLEGFRPYVGVGLGARHYASGDWEKNLKTFRAGFDLMGRSRFGLRGEAFKHTDSGWFAAVGVSLGIFRRSRS
jgi:opacity protein-like surface antigen